MFEEIFAKTNVRFAELLAPARKYNALVLDNFEKLAQFQLAAARSYTDLGVEQLRAALDVSDAQSLQTYVSNQQKIAETVSKKLSSDAETLAALSKDFTVEVQKLAQENVTNLAQFVQNKAKTAATAPKAAPVRKTA